LRQKLRQRHHLRLRYRRADARRAPLDRPRRWIVVALACSSVGDAVLLSASDTAFVFGTVAFAFAHLAFIIAFASVGGGLGFVRRKPLVAVPYVAVWGASAIVLAPHMGTLAFVALPYGFLVMLMALAALNLIGRLPLRSARLAAAGAVLFMISDGTIAEARFAPSLAPPHADLAIMALYLAAQTLTTVAFSA